MIKKNSFNLSLRTLFLILTQKEFKKAVIVMVSKSLGKPTEVMLCSHDFKCP